MEVLGLFSQWLLSANCIHKWLLELQTASGMITYWGVGLIVTQSCRDNMCRDNTMHAGTAQLSESMKGKEEGASFLPPGWSFPCRLQVLINFEKE